MSTGKRIKTEIRKQLKELGFNNRIIGVKERPGGLSWSFKLLIKDPTVDQKQIEDLARTFTSVDRCAASGEIMSGGNVFISVISYDSYLKYWK